MEHEGWQEGTIGPILHPRRGPRFVIRMESQRPCPAEQVNLTPFHATENILVIVLRLTVLIVIVLATNMISIFRFAFEA